jgi:hypothetical protein
MLQCLPRTCVVSGKGIVLKLCIVVVAARSTQEV